MNMQLVFVGWLLEFSDF